MENRTEDFIELFKSLENETDKRYRQVTGTPPDKHVPLMKQVSILQEKNVRVYRKHYNIISYCAKVRNICSHEQKIMDLYIVDVNNYLITELKKIVEELKNPTKVLDVAIQASNIFSANIDDQVKKVIREMKKNTYTHVPIYDGKELIGVFSENTLFNYIFKEEIVEIDNDSKFKGIVEYIKLENLDETIKFVSRNETIEKIEDEYKKEFSAHNKLSCIYITETGKISEKILGMLTAWDILGKEN